MKRNEFLRNALMALAVSLVPKILQPTEYYCYTTKGKVLRFVGTNRTIRITNQPFTCMYKCENGKWSEIRDYAYNK